MKKGQRAGNNPIGVDVVEGKSYFWCTCGNSKKQPFCDGSHKDTDFSPLVKLINPKKYFSAFVNKLMIHLIVMDHITNRSN